MKYLLSVLILLLSTSVMAQPSPELEIQDIPKGEDKILSLAKGQMAPFAGQLFAPDTAIRWANWLHQYKYRLAWDVTLERSKCSVETTYRDNLLGIEKKRADKVEKDLFKRLTSSEQARLEAEEIARNPPWYTTTGFGLGLGVVGTAAVFALAIWGVSAAN